MAKKQACRVAYSDGRKDGASGNNDFNLVRDQCGSPRDGEAAFAKCVRVTRREYQRDLTKSRTADFPDGKCKGTYVRGFLDEYMPKSEARARRVSLSGAPSRRRRK